jgi:tetratricopeptide (TPR) repeat protein
MTAKIIWFALVFALSWQVSPDPDIWFHLKSGEIIASQGVIHHDVFSYTATGREWFPHEWLFEVTVYLLNHWFGFVAIQLGVALLSTYIVWLLCEMFTKVVRMSWPLSWLTAWLFFVLTRDFVTSRPHLIAYALLLTNIYILLLFVKLHKNYVWATLPITILWANIHGSIVLNVWLFVAYTALAWWEGWMEDSSQKFRQGKILLAYTVATIGLTTLLPPLYTTQWRQLWLFWQHRHVVQNFLNEWMPIWILNPWTAGVYSTLALIIIGFWVWITLSHQRWRKQGWLWPLFIFIPLAFTATRNLWLGYMGLAFMAGSTVSQVSSHLFRQKRVITWSASIILIAVSAGYLWQLMTALPTSMPEQATQFIKNQHLAGNMWHSFGQGGYLLYHLYPDQKVFFDGRADLYLCCEMPEFLEITQAKYAPAADFATRLNALWDHHDISFVILPTTPNTIWRATSNILQKDTAWSLVFWDDQAEIYVRRDSQNTAILRAWAAHVATPYENSPYLAGQEETAQKEYMHMVTVADSARSRNALGVISLRLGNISQAETEFAQAVRLNPLFDSPYLNLGEIAASRGDLPQAVQYYEKALEIAPERLFAYARLGQLYRDSLGDPAKANTVWQKGIRHVKDEASKTELQVYLDNKK